MAKVGRPKGSKNKYIRSKYIRELIGRCYAYYKIVTCKFCGVAYKKQAGSINRWNGSCAKCSRKYLKITPEQRKKKSINAKIQVTRQGGVPNAKKFKKGHRPWNTGLVGFFAKEKHYNWQGGKSFEEYPPDWNETLKKMIKKRDNYICKICGVRQLETKIDVHHIDYNKKNCHANNLISLCKPCHTKTNFHRDKWLQYFRRDTEYSKGEQCHTSVT